MKMPTVRKCYNMTDKTIEAKILSHIVHTFLLKLQNKTLQCFLVAFICNCFTLGFQPRAQKLEPPCTA